MIELVRYISRATPLSSSKDHVIQRPNPSEGMREVAHALDTSRRLVEETRHHQASAKAHSDYLQTSLEAEKTFQEKLQGLQGKDEAEVRKGLNDIINKDIKPHYNRLLSKISHPEVSRQMAAE